MPRNRTSKVSPADKLKSSRMLGQTSGFLVSDDHLRSLADAVRRDLPKISDERLAALIAGAEEAVSQLIWDRRTDRKQQRKKLEALSQSAEHLLEKLTAVLGDSSLVSPFTELLVRTHNAAPQIDPHVLNHLPETIRKEVLNRQKSQPPPNRAAILSAQLERRDRIRDHLIGDLFWIRTILEPIIELAKATEGGMKTPEYRCAMRLTKAWYKATGKRPTTTNNKEAKSGPQATAYQRFLAAAVPGAPIGPGIVDIVKRDFGDMNGGNRPNETPKGITRA
jgi:hypothetical protein